MKEPPKPESGVTKESRTGDSAKPDWAMPGICMPGDERVGHDGAFRPFGSAELLSILGMRSRPTIESTGPSQSVTAAMASTWADVFRVKGGRSRADTRPLRELERYIDEKQAEVDATSEELRNAEARYVQRYEGLTDQERAPEAKGVERLDAWLTHLRLGSKRSGRIREDKGRGEGRGVEREVEKVAEPAIAPIS